MRGARCLLLALALASPSVVRAEAEETAAAGPSPLGAAVSLESVLRSTEAHHPRVGAALAQEAVAESEVLASRGGFDPTLQARGALRHGGYYELRRLDAELRAPTPLWGAEVWAGYRLGTGVDPEQRYPTYYSDATLDRGELRAGVRVPILRDGPTDARRADRDRAIARRDAAREQRALTLLELRQRATVAYFAWVAAGRALRVSETLLGLAEARLDAVRRRVEAGAIPEVEILEAERSRLARRGQVVDARRRVEATSIVLGLFLRDGAGDPAPPSPEGLPESLPLPVPPGDPEAAFAVARECMPGIAAQRALLDARRIERDLEQARLLPQLDAEVQVSRDFGEGDLSLPGTVVEAGVVFSVPLGLRAGRGRLGAAEARLAAETENLRLMEDALRADLGDAASAYRASAERLSVLEELARAAERLAEAERQRFEAGATSLLVVNLREASAGEAAVSVVDAVTALWDSAARWEALTRCGGGG